MKGRTLHATVRTRGGARESGVSLVVVMIFLVILSGMAITAMRGASFAALIAGNEADRTLSFQAAEAALKDAGNDIQGFTSDGVTTCAAGCRTPPISFGSGFDAVCTNSLCDPQRVYQPWVKHAADPTITDPNDPRSQAWSNDVWTDGNAKSTTYGSYTGAPALPVVARQPRYILEYFPQGDYSVYRVTAVGFGAQDSTRTMLQATVKKKI